MRIGISIAPLFNLNGTKKQFDGIGTYTANVVDALNNRVSVVPCYFKTVQQTLKAPLPLLKKTADFTVAANPFINQFLPVHCYRELESSIDVFHSTDYKIPKLKHTPVIATLHDAIPFREASHANSKSRAIKNYLLKTAAQNADHVVTITEAMRSDIHQYFGIPHEKISVIYHGINAEWLHPAINRAEVLKKHSVEKPYLIVVGTISPKKNCLRIMQAFSELPSSLQKEFQLLFVGKKGWDCDREISLLKQMQQQKTAQWLEYVDFDDLRALYQASTALVFPSLNEGFGFPTIEAFASNTPVITTHYGATAEIAGDAALLVDPLNTDELSYVMQNLIQDENLRQKFILKGKERIRLFSWVKNADQLISIYQKPYGDIKT